MIRIVSAAILATLLPLAASAQGGVDQLRTQIANSPLIAGAGIDVAALSDAQVNEVFGILMNQEFDDQTKMQRIDGVLGN